MDVFVEVVIVEGRAYLTTGSGDVYRVWFANEPYPFQQQLTEAEARYFHALKPEPRSACI